MSEAEIVIARLREINAEMAAVLRDALQALDLADQDRVDGGVLTGRIREVLAAEARWKADS